jgi:cyanophycinase
MSRGAFAFMGSGEFEPWHDDVDRWLLERADGDGTVLILPTASAREGDEVFEGWATKGLRHYERLGAAASVVPIRSREDADRREFVDALSSASVVFFSGGNPWYLAETLRGSAFCEVMIQRLAEGLAYAGCSAGVACLSEMTFDSDTEDFEQVFKPGLGFVRRTLFGPHWDMIDTWIPGAREFITDSVPEGGRLVAIDEETAMVGDGSSWSVTGRSGVHVWENGNWSDHVTGDGFSLELMDEPKPSVGTG